MWWPRRCRITSVRSLKAQRPEGCRKTDDVDQHWRARRSAQAGGNPREDRLPGRVAPCILSNQ
jgi:hypothetical protein